MLDAFLHLAGVEMPDAEPQKKCSRSRDARCRAAKEMHLAGVEMPDAEMHLAGV